MEGWSELVDARRVPWWVRCGRRRGCLWVRCGCAADALFEACTRRDYD